MDELFQKVLLEHELSVTKLNDKKSTYADQEASIHQQLNALEQEFKIKTQVKCDALKQEYEDKLQLLQDNHHQQLETKIKQLKSNFESQLLPQKESILKGFLNHD